MLVAEMICERFPSAAAGDSYLLVVPAAEVFVTEGAGFDCYPLPLARAALADNAASLASTEDDPVALRLAIDTYTDLLSRAHTSEQRTALENALRSLR